MKRVISKSDTAHISSANYHQIHRLSLLTNWQTWLAPAIPLLADACHVSQAQVQTVLTPLLTTCVYRVSQLAAHPSEGLNQLLAVTYRQTCDYLTAQSGLTLSNLAQLMPNTHALTAPWFTDSPRWHALLGMLMAASRLDLAVLDKLAALIVSLAFITLSWLWRDSQNAVVNAAVSVTTAQLIEWLRQQPIYLHSAGSDSATLFAQRALANYQTTISLRAEQRLYQRLTKYGLSGLAGWQQILTDQLQAYTTRQPLAITPKALPKYASKAAPITKPKRPTAPSNNINTDIFAKPARQTRQKTIPLRALHSGSLTTRLQQHWIATALGLSALVFGGLAWAWSAWLPKPVSKPADTVASAPKIDNYQDVAIVRVASATADTASTTKQTPARAANSTKSANKEDNPTAKATVSAQANATQKATKPPKDKTPTDKTSAQASTKTDTSTKEKDNAKKATEKKPTDKKDTSSPSKNKTADKSPDKTTAKTTKAKKSDRKTAKDHPNDDDASTNSASKKDKAKSTRNNAAKDNKRDNQTAAKKS